MKKTHMEKKYNELLQDMIRKGIGGKWSNWLRVNFKICEMLQGNRKKDAYKEMCRNSSRKIITGTEM